MAAGTPLSAKNAVVRVNTNIVLYQSKWSVKPKTKWEDTTNAEGNGFETQTACTRAATVSVEGWWDAGKNTYDANPNPGIQDGVNLANVYLYTSGTTSPYWLFPTLSVEDLEHDGETASIHKFKFNGKGNGSFSYPTGNAA